MIIQELSERIRLLETRMKSIEQEVESRHKQTTEPEELENIENPEYPTKKTTEKPKEKVKEVNWLPPANILWNGDHDDNFQPSSRSDPQPFDWTTVKLPRRRKENRPQLSETMNNDVEQKLQEHIETKYTGKNIKMKPQKQMPEEVRQKTIQQMLAKSGLIVGVGPITGDHIDRVRKALANRGVFSQDENPAQRKQRTIKSLIKTWALKNLKMEEEIWESIQMEELILNENSDTVFIKCKTTQDASKFTSRAKNLHQENEPDTPRIIMWVDQRASKRFKAIQTIAKAMRDHTPNTIQTTIITGKKDFLLRKRNKGDQTPWSEVPPVILTQKIPEFEVGSYNDILNPDNINPNEPETENKEEDPNDIENIELIIQDMTRQNTEITTKKRDRTIEEDKLNKKKRSTPNEMDNLSQPSPDITPIPSNDEDNESDQRKISNKQILNSTLINKPGIPTSKSIQLADNSVKMITHYFSVPETPNMIRKDNQPNIFRPIPETPENENHQKTRMSHPTTRNNENRNRTDQTTNYEQEQWDTTRQDYAIIEEFNESKNNLNYHGQ